MKVAFLMLLSIMLYAGDGIDPTVIDLKEKPNWKKHLEISSEYKSPFIGKDYIEVRIESRARLYTYCNFEIEIHFFDKQGKTVQIEKHKINGCRDRMSYEDYKVYHNYRSNNATFIVKLVNAKPIKPKLAPKPKGKKVIPEFAPEFQ